ncbi:ADOP family duplicated permease [Gemmatimonadota bacterium]
MGPVRRWIIRLLLRDDLARIEREIEEEFRFHIDMKAASLRAQGMDPEDARALALDRFGDLESLRQAGVRDLSGARSGERRASHMDWMGQDLRDACRQWVRRPGFALLAAGTLALGLAASTAVFTYVNAYSQPFPGADARDLYQLFLTSEQAPFGNLSYPDYLDLTATGDGLFRTAGYGQPLFAASVRHETLTEVVFGQGVTGDFFRLVGVEMTVGRGLTPDDDRPEAEPAVVLSHEYWIRRYGPDSGVLERTILLNNQPYTIVGVAGPEFLGSMSAWRPQVWLPFESFKRVYWARSNTEVNREAGAVSPYLRLEEGVDGEQAEQALEALARSLDVQAPLSERSRIFRLEPATWIHPSVRQAELPTTRIMLMAAGCLLLLACANVANLVLSAGTRRHQEMALRSAMGASRWRLVRQLLGENLLLSLVAGGLALAVAGPAGDRLSSYFARPSVWGANVPREITIDPKVLAFALLAAVLTGILTGLVPAFKTSGKNLVPTLKAGNQWSSAETSRRPSRMPGARDLLVSAQVALSVVLLFLAGLVIRTLDSAKGVDAGFDTQWTLASYISTSSMGTPVAEREAFFRELAQRFEEMPWVRAATVAENAPLSGHPVREFRADGSDEPVRTTVARVMPGFFEAMEMEILRGRAFLATDTADALGVVVVNETLARRVTADGNAVGRRLLWPAENDTPPRSFEVIGVVKNARQTTYLDDPEPVAYFSFPQHYFPPGNAFLLKVAGNPAAAVQRMEEELQAVDPRIAIVNILPYSEVVGGFLYTQRMNAELFGIIAALGLILSAAGIFGVVSLAVARRRKEIGIRLALGAQGGDITRLVVRRVTVSLGVGLLVGSIGALLATRLVESLLWGVEPTDPVSLGVGMGVLLAAVVLAVGVPVGRALRVDPVGSLRAE